MWTGRFTEACRTHSGSVGFAYSYPCSHYSHSDAPSSSPYTYSSAYPYTRSTRG
jgi:hypothetical protein